MFICQILNETLKSATYQAGACAVHKLGPAACPSGVCGKHLRFCAAQLAARLGLLLSAQRQALASAAAPW